MAKTSTRCRGDAHVYRAEGCRTRARTVRRTSAALPAAPPPPPPTIAALRIYTSARHENLYENFDRINTLKLKPTRQRQRRVYQSKTIKTSAGEISYFYYRFTRERNNLRQREFYTFFQTIGRNFSAGFLSHCL